MSLGTCTILSLQRDCFRRNDPERRQNSLPGLRPLRPEFAVGLEATWVINYVIMAQGTGPLGPGMANPPNRPSLTVLS